LSFLESKIDFREKRGEKVRESEKMKEGKVVEGINVEERRHRRNTEKISIQATGGGGMFSRGELPQNTLLCGPSFKKGRKRNEDPSRKI